MPRGTLVRMESLRSCRALTNWIGPDVSSHYGGVTVRAAGPHHGVNLCDIYYPRQLSRVKILDVSKAK